MRDNAVLDILMASDENYALLMGVCCSSIIKNNQCFDKINLHLIENNISDEHKSRFQSFVDEKVSVTFYPAKKYIEIAEHNNLPTWRGNYMAYVPLFAIDDIQPESGLLTYIDCDSLILKPLSKIYEIDTTLPLYMVLYPLFSKAYFDQIGIDRFSYYGSAIWTVNYENLKGSFSGKILSSNYAEKYLAARDQDMINLAFSGEIFSLPYNYQYTETFEMYNPATYLKLYGVKKEKSREVEEEIVLAKQDIVILNLNHGWRGAVWDEEDYINPFFGLPWKEYWRESPWKDCKLKSRHITFPGYVSIALMKILPRRAYTVVGALFTDIFVKLNK